MINNRRSASGGLVGHRKFLKNVDVKERGNQIKHKRPEGLQ